VPGRVVVERQQLIQVVGDLRDRLGELGSVGSIEGLRRGPGMVLVLGTPDLGQAFFAPWCADFGSAASTFAVL
jgi:hypothetical protein